jgi:hypothetical protein
MNKITTYLDDSAGVALTPQPKPRLLFKAWLSHGPGHDEDLAFYVGPDDENTHDVLWLESDYAEGATALAWVQRGILSGDELNNALLEAYWQREKDENESEEPNYTEVLKTQGAALSPEQVNELANKIWPEL